MSTISAHHVRVRVPVWMVAFCTLACATNRPPAPPSSPPPSNGQARGADSCLHDRAFEGEVGTAIVGIVRNAGLDTRLSPVVEFECPRREAPRYIEGLRAMGAFTPLELLSADVVSDDEVHVRRILLKPRPAWPTIDSAPPFEVTSAVIRGAAARRASGLSRASLAARVALIEADPTEGGALILHGTSNEEAALALRATTNAEEIERAYVGIATAPSVAERAPIEVAFAALVQIIDGAPPAAPVDADHRLFAQLWHSDDLVGHARWLDLELLDLASVLGGPDVLPDAKRWLQDAKNDSERVLAIRALAAITGHMPSRDPGGHLRPLAEIVAEYHALLEEGAR